MLFQFELGRLDDVVLPQSWSKYLGRTHGGLRITGDRTGYRELYVHCGPKAGAVASSLGELLEHLRAQGQAVELSAFGISSLLHHGLIPLPHTVYEDIYFLSMGDTADIGGLGRTLTIDLSNDYPWSVDRSRNDGQASEETLLSLLTRATERQLDEFGNEGFLMLSSGKDSPAVALALAEGGFKHIRCVTYSSGAGDPEPPIAADICRRLGLDHEIVEMPADPERTAEALIRFFEVPASPGVDLSQLPYVFATAAALPASGAVIDGGGNDSYMGYPVTGHDLTKLRFRVRGRTLANAVRRAVPVDSPLNYLARSRAEATLPGRTLRFSDSRKLYPAAMDTSRWWYDLSRETRHLDLFDLCGEVQERHTGPGASMQKQRLAANAIGLGASLPWCDDDLADYYFNLPERDRYDRRSGRNKIVLRRMLHRYLDYDAEAIGKHYFGFDGARFIQTNMDFVRSEIDSCSLWDRGGLPVIHEWLDKIGSRPLLYHSLLTVFMVSGWHNHSRLLNRDRVADTSFGHSG